MEALRANIVPGELIATKVVQMIAHYAPAGNFPPEKNPAERTAPKLLGPHFAKFAQTESSQPTETWLAHIAPGELTEAELVQITAHRVRRGPSPSNNRLLAERTVLRQVLPVEKAAPKRLR